MANHQSSLSGLLGELAPAIRIVDIGALWLGDGALAYRSLLETGRASVIGFEPIANECDQTAENLVAVQHHWQTASRHFEAILGLDLPQGVPIVKMACANQTAGGVELVVVETPAGLVQYGHPNVEGQPQSADSRHSDGGGGRLAAQRFAE